MKVVIVGGVAGGASAAARLRRLDESARIVVLEKGDYVSYANCGLPYYIGGEITEEKALTLQTPESFKARFNVDVRLKSEVVSISPQNKFMMVKNLVNGQIYRETYDKVILSPGASPVLPPLPGVEDPRIFTLRSIPDSKRIREAIAGGARRAVIVGGGYIGVEMAQNLMEAGLEVAVVEMAEHLIAPLDYDMACDVHRYLKMKGVKLVIGQSVTEFLPGEKELEVRLSGGESLPADLVLLSAGVRPDTAFVAEAGVMMGERGAIVVDEHMLTSDENIYAVGDAVECADLITGAPVYIPLAGPANKQGRIAAGHICGLDVSYEGTQGSSVMKLFDMTVAVTGLNEKAVQASGLEYDKVFLYSPSHAAYYPGATNMSLKVLFQKKSGKILGAQIVGFDGVDKRCDVLATAIRAGMTAYDLTELELGYAPPFSSAKDPVNMAGFVMENLLSGRVKQYHWHDVAGLPRDGSVTLLDVRTPAEYIRGHIEGTVHIPLDTLREHLDDLDKKKPVYVNCQSGLRSYIACRLLAQSGFNCYNLAGGYRLYDAVTSAKEFDGTPVHNCGEKI